MLENTWAKQYLKGLLEVDGKNFDDLEELVDATGLDDVENPLLEIAFLRQGNSPVECFRMAVTALALCREDAQLSLVADLLETVEECQLKLLLLEEGLQKVKEAAADDPDNGERLANLGFALAAAGEKEEALSAYTKALERPDTLCIQCHRDCLVNIGWDHYLKGEYDEALGWFDHACRLKAAEHPPAHGGDSETESDDTPYPLALENVLLTLAKMGRLSEAAKRLEEYHEHFGRLPAYETAALENLGLRPDLVYIRSRIRYFADQATAS